MTQKSKDLGIYTTGLQHGHILKNADGLFTVMTTEYYYGPTYAKGQQLTFHRRYDGRYELVNISNIVS
jgi:hypothetical protein